MNRRWVESPSGCWEWLGAHDVTGYGRIRIAGRLELAHHAFDGDNVRIYRGRRYCRACEAMRRRARRPELERRAS